MNFFHSFDGRYSLTVRDNVDEPPGKQSWCALLINDRRCRKCALRCRSSTHRVESSLKGITRFIILSVAFAARIRELVVVVVAAKPVPLKSHRESIPRPHAARFCAHPHDDFILPSMRSQPP